MSVALSVAAVLAPAVAARPDALALITRTRRLTYAELDRAANRAAHALLALGVRPGDRVAAALPNEADIVIAFHGAMRIGAVWVGLNRALAPPEKDFILSDSGASLVLDDDSLADWQGAVVAADDSPCGIGIEIDPFAPAAIG